MNDLMKEIIVESGLGRKLIHPSSPNGRHISIDPDMQQKAQKFAELILKECTKIIDAPSSEKLTKHFGIK